MRSRKREMKSSKKNRRTKNGSSMARWWSSKVCWWARRLRKSICLMNTLFEGCQTMRSFDIHISSLLWIFPIFCLILEERSPWSIKSDDFNTWVKNEDTLSRVFSSSEKKSLNSLNSLSHYVIAFIYYEYSFQRFLPIPKTRRQLF